MAIMRLSLLSCDAIYSIFVDKNGAIEALM